MLKLRQQPTSSERQMSSLRQRLKRPETYLITLFLLLILAVLDSFRDPAQQITGQFYVGGVRVYQFIGRPLLKGYIQCRYQPTCSDYSIEAVQKHGIRTGVRLTVRRINACQTTVPMGTLNPVPSLP